MYSYWMAAAFGSHVDARTRRCLVFPSLWYETFGLVVDEAAARGIPAIVSDISAAAERVIEGLTGWHFGPDSPDALKSCLSLIKDDKRVRDAGKAAFERYWQNPSQRGRHIGELITLYRRILVRREGSHNSRSV